MTVNQTRTHHRTCTLCEAMCGIEIKLDGNEILSIKGDKLDTFSQGHICPKAVALKDLYLDPDRLKQPLMKTTKGWEEISWSKALEESAKQLGTIQRQYGRDAVGAYLGNPTVHNLQSMVFGSGFFRQLRTKNRFSATSVDQLPHHVAALLMFGHHFLLPIPDIERTDFMVIMGANPVVSNGSIMSVPNVKKRLKAVQQRGGKLVTIDPRFTETSKIADQHLYIKPGSDALLLIGMIQYLITKNWVNFGHLNDHISEFERLKATFSGWSDELISSNTGIDTAHIEELVDEFCHAKSAVLYARIGVSTHEFGSIVNWLVNLFNLLTGNMDRKGGAMFTQPAIDMVGRKKPKEKKFARYFSRVSQYPETAGELPVVALAEEILTPGKGQIKALITAAGNPCLSIPNNTKMDEALESLDFMLSIDYFLNETTRHADIILPPPSPLERSHYDLVFNHLAVRNVAKYSPKLFNKPKGSLSEGEIYTTLSYLMAPSGLLSKAKAWLTMKTLNFLKSEGIIDSRLKKGIYGDKKYTSNRGLSINMLKQHPHGIDLGPLVSCFPERILTPNGKINLAPDELIEDMKRLKKKYAQTNNRAQTQRDYPFSLIGRRDSRTCNSWMHNCYRLVKGKQVCLAYINTQDAIEIGIQSGQTIRVSSRVGEIRLAAQRCDDIMPGVISIPHGWGHDRSDTRLSIAKSHAGVSINQLTDDKFVDSLSGNAAFNGVAVAIQIAVEN